MNSPCEFSDLGEVDTLCYFNSHSVKELFTEAAEVRQQGRMDLGMFVPRRRLVVSQWLDEDSATPVPYWMRNSLQFNYRLPVMIWLVFIKSHL